MLSDEEVRQHRLAADGCNLNGCSHVEALLSDRAEMQAEIYRLRAVAEAARRVDLTFAEDEFSWREGLTDAEKDELNGLCEALAAWKEGK